MNAKKMPLAALAVLLAAGTAAALTLEEGFKTPPNSAKPHTWYHMMNGNVTKEGLTCDFEALAKAGVGGVQMFDAGCNIPPGPLDFNSPEWFDMFLHAAKEARRLGLEICIPNCSGWSSSGGPWNMPSNGMKFVTWREVKTTGPAKFHAKLPRDMNDHGFYEDIAVLAFPTPSAESLTFPEVKTTVSGNSFLLSSDKPFTAPAVTFQISYGHVWAGDAMVSVETSADGMSFTRLEFFRIPIARSGVGNHGERFHAFPAPVTARAIRLTFSKSPVALKLRAARPEARARLSNLPAKTFAVRQECALDTTPARADQVVAKDKVRDITAHLAPDGTLDWNVPAGDWTVMRIGYICNGRCNHPASDHGRGLEVDKLSASAMDYHFNQYVTRLCEHLGSLAGAVESGFNNILVDSYEVASQNWTQGFDKTFEARMGYSLRPYLPVFAGRIVGSVDESERFLEDFRRVVADLFAENYAGRLAELCHKHGLLLSIEPYGNAPCDNLQYGQDVDIPMGEFWSSAMSGDHVMGAGNGRFAAYLAHVWGRRYAATESFTASPDHGGRWLTTPFTIKAQGDGAYCEGVNRIIYHRFTHQPWPGNKYLPGMTMGRWGMHLDRTQTWWEFSGPWFRYQARCQWMLQEGKFVADALFFCGEQAPNQGGNSDGAGASDMRLPSGYNWDICATKAVEMLKVENGRVVAPGGVSYALLILPPQETMSEKMLSTVERLLDEGAKVCGLVKPVRAPGLRGYPTADGRVRALAEKVWAKGVLTCRPAEALAQLGVKPDFATEEKRPAPQWIHRRGDGADWYFVALNNVETRSFEVSFRQTGRTPEVWDAETGTARPADVWREVDGRTYVTLTFPPSGSAFVVFRSVASGEHAVNVAVKATPRPEPVEPEAKHTLTIKKALYGVFATPGRPDCSEVSSYLKPGVRVAVKNEALGGDPASMQHKALEVKYVLDGQEKCDVVKEHASYTLPVGAKLKSAWYGVIDPKWKPAEDMVVDITKKIAAKVKDGKVSVKIDNGLAGGDPMYLTKKVGRITYTYDGVTRTTTVPENSLFNMPAAAPLDAPPIWEWRDGKILAWQPMTADMTSASGPVTRYKADPPAPVLVGGAWNVAFPEGWDAPASVTFPRLVSWTERPEDGIKFFSGTATYTKRVSAPPLQSGARLVLDLGNVKNFAEVTVNGKTFPVLWKPPFRVDITDALGGSHAYATGGTLDLSIRVTNLWPNRLIGDDRLYADDCEWKGVMRKGVKEIGIKELPQWVKDGKRSPTGRHTFTTWKHWDKHDDLLPSGLIGPVLLRTGVFAHEVK